MEIDKRQLWESCFPQLAASSEKEINRLYEKSKVISIEPEQIVLMPGSPCNDYILVAKGKIRVQLLTESGNEVLLYHIGSGEDCVLSTSCLFSGNPYPAEGITETPVIAFAIGKTDFNRLFEDSSVFRKFIFSSFGQRLATVIARMEFLCHSSIENKLAEQLIKLSRNQNPILITHKQLAAELDSAREVISRHLKKFKDSGLVNLHRGSIEVISEQKLTQIWNKSGRLQAAPKG